MARKKSCTDNLKFCPFCGKKPYLVVDYWGAYYVACSCGVRLEECSTKEEAINSWNRRV